MRIEEKRLTIKSNKEQQKEYARMANELRVQNNESLSTINHANKSALAAYKDQSPVKGNTNAQSKSQVEK